MLRIGNIESNTYAENCTPDFTPVPRPIFYPRSYLDQRFCNNMLVWPRSEDYTSFPICASPQFYNTPLRQEKDGTMQLYRVSSQSRISSESIFPSQKVESKIKKYNKYFKKFIKELVEHHYEDFSDLGFITDSTCKKDIYRKILEKSWDRVPGFFKKWKTKEQILHDESPLSFVNLFEIATKEVHKQLKKEESKDHRITFWGSTGHGKSTLLLILSTILNLINPEDKQLSKVQVNHHTTGTTEVIKDITVYIGTIKVTFTDVPGCNDYNDAIKESQILKQLQDSEKLMNAILYVYDVSNGRFETKDAMTLEYLAHGFKNMGLDIWSQVIIVLSKANLIDSPTIKEPQYDPKKSSPDYDKKFIKRYTKYMIDKRDFVKKRINERKKDIFRAFENLFEDQKNPYFETTSKEEIKSTFKKIKFVVAGFVNDISEETDDFQEVQDSFSETEEDYLDSADLDDSNDESLEREFDFKNSRAMPIPEFKIPYGIDQDSIFGRAFKKRINEDKFIISRNWCAELTNLMLQCSNSDITIGIDSINTDFTERNEKEKEKDSKKDTYIKDSLVPSTSEEGIKNFRPSKETRDVAIEGKKEQINKTIERSWSQIIGNTIIKVLSFVFVTPFEKVFGKK